MPDNGPDTASRDVIIDEIIAYAAEARKHLGKLEHRLQGEIDDIDFVAFAKRRPLTVKEGEQRRQLRVSQMEVRDAFIQLAGAFYLLPTMNL